MDRLASIASAQGVFIGPNGRMRQVFEFVRVVAHGEGTVLITGESGTGKEVVAALIHALSARARHPFVAVSCTLFSETLIESELFGHERGAFTGAIRARAGRFEQAEAGTVLLDDIDDVPLAMQVKLLRVLQNRTVERLGGTRAIPVDIRVIAGSKRDLAAMVAAGTFREDLFHRLNVVPLALPPLRERMDDVPALAESFLRRSFGRAGKEAPPLTDGVKLALAAYDWPGNVRELENLCERMAQTNTCGTLGVGCLAATMMLGPNAGPVAGSVPSPAPADVEPISLDARLQDLEAALIAWALRASGGNHTRASELLQVKRSTFTDRMTRARRGRLRSPS